MGAIPFIAMGLLGLQFVGFLWMIDRLITTQQQERRELEDRLMATFHPDALIQQKAHQDVVPATVSYVDERREFELSPVGGGE